MPNLFHQPILTTEVLQALRPRPGGRYVDATLGGAGHAAAILDASSPTGWLFGCDRDGEAMAAAELRLSLFTGRFEIRRGNYSELADWIETGSCDGALLDLGVSSHQLDRAERGFSFQQDGVLDMRMDSRQPLTAAQVVNGWSESDLATIFWEFGQEPQAKRFARAIAQDRQAQRFETTRQLAALIERLAPRHGQRKHPATRVFQALRITVNDENRSLQSGLAAACQILKPGGRLVIITFHSIEDRIVKKFGSEKSRGYTFEGEIDVPALRQPCAAELKWIQRKAMRPSDVEIAANPRARSAQLRVFEKL